MKKILNFIFSFFLFLSLNIPSVKILYSSEIINISILIGIWLFGLTRIILIKNGKIPYSNKKSKFFLLFFILWFILIGNSLIYSSLLHFSDFAQYISVVFMVIGSTLFFEYSDLRKIFMFQIIWGAFLSIGSLFQFITLNLSLGQHYLTLGLPIAGAIIVNIVDLIVKFDFYKKNKLLIGTRMVLLIFSVTAVSSLQGRSPVILSIIIPIFTILTIIMKENNVRKKLRGLIFTIIIAAATIFIIISNVSDYWIARFDGLANYENEPRYFIYVKALKIIQESPFDLSTSYIPFVSMALALTSTEIKDIKEVL